jgi:hypothetical protein
MMVWHESGQYDCAVSYNVSKLVAITRRQQEDEEARKSAASGGARKERRCEKKQMHNHINRIYQDRYENNVHACECANTC